MDFKPFKNLEKAKFEHKQAKKPFNTLMEIPERPEYIVKESTNRTWWGGNDDKFENAHIIKSYIDKIQLPEIGIAVHIPKTEVVVGYKKGRKDKGVFTIQEKIEGSFITQEAARRAFVEDPEGNIAQAIRDIGKIVKGVVALYIKTFSDGEGDSVEISKIRNFIYGTNAARPDLPKTVYLVDFIPVYKDEPMHLEEDLRELLVDYPMLAPMLEEDLQKIQTLKQLRFKQ